MVEGHFGQLFYLFCDYTSIFLDVGLEVQLFFFSNQHQWFSFWHWGYLRRFRDIISIYSWVVGHSYHLIGCIFLFFLSNCKVNHTCITSYIACILSKTSKVVWILYSVFHPKNKICRLCNNSLNIAGLTICHPHESINLDNIQNPNTICLLITNLYISHLHMTLQALWLPCWNVQSVLINCIHSTLFSQVISYP